MKIGIRILVETFEYAELPMQPETQSQCFDVGSIFPSFYLVRLGRENRLMINIL